MLMIVDEAFDDVDGWHMPFDAKTLLPTPG